MNHFVNTFLRRLHRMQLNRLSIGAVFAMLLIISASNAEEAAPKAETLPAANAGEPARPTGPIQYVGPDTYILLDAQGRPQPVPGMTYEDFLAAWKKLNNPANADNQPRFTIESIRFDGQTHGSRAELKLEVTIHLLANGPVNVPLGLVGAVLQGEPQFNKSDSKPQQVS